MLHLETHCITLQNLLDAGILKAGIRIYAETDSNLIATLSHSGNILLDINGSIVEKQSLSGAAKAITGKSINGWLFWKAEEAGRLETLSFFRDKYQQEVR